MPEHRVVFSLELLGSSLALLCDRNGFNTLFEFVERVLFEVALVCGEA